MFRPGQSGNPKGRKPGALGKKTLALAAEPIEVEATKGKNGHDAPHNFCQLGFLHRLLFLQSSQTAPTV
jgi:hypothetical protein